MSRDKTTSLDFLEGCFPCKYSYIFEWSCVHGDICWGYVCSVESLINLFLVQTVSSLSHFLFASTCPKTNVKIVLIFKKTSTATDLSLHLYGFCWCPNWTSCRETCYGFLAHLKTQSNQNSIIFLDPLVIKCAMRFTEIYKRYFSPPLSTLFLISAHEDLYSGRFLVSNSNQKVSCVNLMHR